MKRMYMVRPIFLKGHVIVTAETYEDAICEGAYMLQCQVDAVTCEPYNSADYEKTWDQIYGETNPEVVVEFFHEPHQEDYYQQ